MQLVKSIFKSTKRLIYSSAILVASHCRGFRNSENYQNVIFDKKQPPSLKIYQKNIFSFFHEHPLVFRTINVKKRSTVITTLIKSKLLCHRLNFFSDALVYSRYIQ